MNRWVILGTLCLIRFGIGFQFQTIGSAAPFLVQDLGIDYGQIGTLVGLFLLPGIVLAIPAGFVGKHFGDKRVTVVATGVMVVGGVVCSFAATYEQLFVGRLLCGAGTAVLFVLLTKMVTDWFAGRELFLGMSVYIVGWPVGIAVGQAVQPGLLGLTSVPVVFLLSAIVLAAGLVSVVLLYQSPPQLSPTASGSSSSRLSGRELWLVSITAAMWMVINGAYIVIVSFGPVLVTEQGWTPTDAAFVVSIVSWAFLFGLPLGGYIATRFSIPNVVMVSGLFVTIVAGVAIPYTSVPWVTFSVFGLFYALAAPVVGSLPAEVLRPENRGPGLGVFQVGNFIGSAISPVIGGVALDLSGTASSSVMFATALMIVTLTLLGVFRFEQRRLPLE